MRKIWQFMSNYTFFSLLKYNTACFSRNDKTQSFIISTASSTSFRVLCFEKVNLNEDNASSVFRPIAVSTYEGETEPEAQAEPAEQSTPFISKLKSKAVAETPTNVTLAF